MLMQIPSSNAPSEPHLELIKRKWSGTYKREEGAHHLFQDTAPLTENRENHEELPLVELGSSIRSNRITCDYKPGVLPVHQPTIRYCTGRTCKRVRDP
jgi:hypothetical protein